MRRFQIMAYIVKRSKSTNTYTTESTDVYNSVRENDSNTISTMGEYEYYVNIPRRCSRCRMYNLEPGTCKKKKDWETCRKSYSIKKVKNC